MPDPQLIRVKKYPNRRLYDGSRSRHLTHEQLYDLVVAGHTVSVTDSKTGADITNLVLMQALIEHSPEKFAAFPPEVSHLMIRASEQMLRGASNNWFLQFMKSMSPMAVGAATPFGIGATAPFGIGATAPFGAGIGRGTAAPESARDDDLAAMRTQLDAMMKEIVSLKRSKGRAR